MGGGGGGVQDECINNISPQYRVTYYILILCYDGYPIDMYLVETSIILKHA